MVPEKKLGRPTDNPKSLPIHVRLDKECTEILEKYCSIYQLSRAEAIRTGIKKLDDDLKQK